MWLYCSYLGILTPNRPAMPFGNRKNYFRGSFQLVSLQFKKYHPSVNLKFNNLGIFTSLKLRILIEKNHSNFSLAKFHSKMSGRLWVKTANKHLCNHYIYVEIEPSALRSTLSLGNANERICFIVISPFCSSCLQIPFYPIVKKDLTFINLGNHSKVDGLINFEKLRMIAKEVRTLTNMCSSPYGFLTMLELGQ